MLKSHLKTTFIVWLILFAIFCPRSIFQHVTVEASNTINFPQIQLNQTANIKVVFLGVPPDLINESTFLSSITRNVNQFAHSTDMTWNLNISIVFHEFPENITTLLIDNAYVFKGTTYYNITLLDDLLSQLEYLAIPKCGYLIVFMRILDAAINHSWFYVQERPDLFLGRTDYFNNEPSRYWAFPPYFGGMRRVLYFDLSDVVERTPEKSLVTDKTISLFNNCLGDVFVNLLGKTDSRMVEADMQKYENYELRTLWLNGTGEQINIDQIEGAFEDLMPWTNLSITLQTRPMEAELNNLIETRTEELSKPLNYTFTLANGSKFSIEANRDVLWEVWKDPGEYDPISRYLFDHVKKYFNLTDLENKSVIPIIFLQTRNDTAIGGVAGIGPGVSWFPYNVIIMGYQGGTITSMGDSGSILLAHQLRHEIGHWLSLPHHSARFELGYPKVVCSMRSITNRFCAFCKDARARMSFISYYKATIELISNKQAKAELLRQELEEALQLFYGWEYIQAVETIISVYYKAQLPILIVKVTAYPDATRSGETSNITVHVTDDINPISNVTITLSSEKGGTFLLKTGETDSNGSFFSVFTAPSVTEKTTCILTANATKTEYLSGQNQTQITVSPSIVDFTWIWFAIVAVAVILSFVLIFRKKLGLFRASSEYRSEQSTSKIESKNIMLRRELSLC
jgi:hypothetical protein